MIFRNTCLLEIEAVLPPQFISSEEIEGEIKGTYDRLKLSQGRLELFTGIKRRGFWAVGTKPSSIAIEAGRKILEKHKHDISDIDLLINASVCRDQLEPATAMEIHGQLGLSSSTLTFDLSNACLGVMNAVAVAGQMIESGAVRKALVVSGENSGPLLNQTINSINKNNQISRQDLKSMLANFTIGSAGVAILLGRASDCLDAPRITQCVTQTEGKFSHLCHGDGTPESLVMKTESEELLIAGTQLAQSTFNLFLREAKARPSDYNWVIGHQVGIAHEEKIMGQLGLKEIATHRTYPDFGNTGSVALPLTLWDLKRSKEIKKRDRFCLLGIGSGLSCSILELNW